MLITNDKAAGAAGFHWEAGQVQEIPDDLAAELLTIQDSGFRVADEEFDTLTDEIHTEVEETATEVAPAASTEGLTADAAPLD